MNLEQYSIEIRKVIPDITEEQIKSIFKVYNDIKRYGVSFHDFTKVFRGSYIKEEICRCDDGKMFDDNTTDGNCLNCD